MGLILFLVQAPPDCLFFLLVFLSFFFRLFRYWSTPLYLPKYSAKRLCFFHFFIYKTEMLFTARRWIFLPSAPHLRKTLRPPPFCVEVVCRIGWDAWLLRFIADAILIHREEALYVLG